MNTFSIHAIKYIKSSESLPWSVHLHSHKNFTELSLLISGEGKLFCNNESYEIKPGMVIIKPPGILHAEYSMKTNPIEQYCIAIDFTENCNEIFHSFNIPSVGSHILLNNYLVSNIRLLYNLRKSQENTDEILYKIVESNLINTIAHLVTKYSILDEKRTKYSPLIQDTLNCVKNNYQKDISLQSLADQMYVSPSHLSRQFKKEIGITFSNYLSDIRIGEAQRMLLFCDATNEKIASACGFSNIQYFYKQFKNMTSLTPSEFRKKYQ